MYYNKSLKHYLDDLAAKLPAPGGGSSASLVAANGASLISMVVNFTLGKPKYAKYENKLLRILAASEDLRKRFLELVDLDVEAYRSKNINKALDVPFTLARFCFEAIKLCAPLAMAGNKNLASDVAVAAVLLEAAFTSACFNVEINLKGLGDKKLSAAIKKELSKKAKTVKMVRQKTEDEIGKIIRG